MNKIYTKLFIALLFVLGTVGANAQSVANYAVARTTGNSYTSISGTGTSPSATATWRNGNTQTDDNLSGVLPIGFTFFYMGTAYTSFSVSTNGFMTFNTGTAAIGSLTGAYGYQNTQFSTTSGSVSTLAPFYEDLQTAANASTQADLDASIKYSTTGTAGSRILTVEWINMQDFSTTSTSSFNFQVKLYESDGHIEYNYSTFTLANSGTVTTMSYSLGINAASISASPTTAELLTQQTENTATFSNTPSNALGGATPSNMPTSGTRYTFTATGTTAPTSLNITSVTGTGMTLNWTDNSSDEVGFAIFRSTDNVTFTYVSTTLANAVSSPQTGLSFSTTYYWKVYAVREVLSSASNTASAATNAPSLSGTKTVGPTGTYASLTAAFADINTNGLAGNVNLTLQSTYVSSVETFPIVTSTATPVGSFSVTVYPLATGLSITSSSTTGTINLNNGTNIVFDGRVNATGSAKDLIIENTATAGYTMQFINDANGNTVKYCTVKGVNTSTTSGTIMFTTTTGTTGNDNNTIDNCDVKDGATTPTNAIYSSGTTTTTAQNNSGNIISNNNIYNYFAAALDHYGVNLLGGTTDWTITGNSFYQTASRNMTTSGTTSGVRISNSSSGNNFLISGNYIGGTAALCGGSAMTYTGTSTTIGIIFRGLQLTVGTTTATSIQGNTVQNLNISTYSTSTSQSGFSLITGKFNVGTVTSNTIGSQSSTSSIIFVNSGTSVAVIFTGILAGTGTGDIINIQNNTIGGIAISTTSTGSVSFRGIGFQGSTGTYTISGNTIGSLSTASSITNSTNNSILGILGSASNSSVTQNITTNSIANLSSTTISSGAQVVGILAQGSSGGIYNTTGNTIKSLSSTATNTSTSGSSSIVGISHTAATTAGQTVSQNTVHSLSNTTAGATAVSIVGIFYSGPSTGTNLVARNFVHSISLSSTSTSSIITGLQDGGGTGTTYQNNMIRLGINAAGASITTGYTINGIAQTSGTSDKFYNNSVYIGGTGVVAGTATFAFIRSQTAAAVDVRNNIFVNARSNSSTGAIKNYCISISGTTDYSTPFLTSNYNIYYANGTDGVMGRINAVNQTTLLAWRNTSTGVLDLVSGYGDPNFVLPSDPAATVDLHVQGTTPAEGAGLSGLGVTDDYDGTTRSGLTPEDIGADAGNFTASDIFPPSISYTALANAAGVSTRSATNITITDVGNAGVNTAANTKPRLYYKRSTDTDVFNDNTNGTAGWKYVEANGTTSPFDFTIDYSKISGGSVAVTNIIQYFIIAQDLAGTPNVGTNNAGFTTPQTGVALVAGNFPTVAGPVLRSYTIVNAVPTTLSVGTGQTYTSLTASGATGLFNAINTGTLTGNTTVTVVSDLAETGAVQLTNAGMAGFTLLIQSDGTLRTLSGNTGASGTPLVGINGAAGVTIDGLVGSKFLTIRNVNGAAPSLSVGPAVQVLGGTTTFVLKNCNLESNASTSTIGTVTLGTGTNSVTIDNNEIRGASNSATNAAANGIYSATTTNTATITNNNIYNWTTSGILLSSVADGATITANSLYNTGTASTAMTAISIGSNNNHNISNNFIGGSAASCGGSAFTNNGAIAFTGINLVVGTTTASSVQNNTIQNISLTSTLGSSFVGITSSTGALNIGTVTGNIIGHASTANSILHAGTSSVTGINVTSSSAVSVQNNTIANISSTSTSGSSNNVVGISASSSTTAYTISSNSIYSLKSGSTSASGIGSVGGINFSGSNNTNVVSQNTINNLENTNAGAVSPRVIGIYTTSSMGGTIRRNRIYNFIVASANSGTPDLRGIYMFQSSGTLTLGSNQISLGVGVTNNVVIYGIADNTSSSFNTNLFYNTIYVGGTVTSGASSTAALSRQLASVTNAKNNFYYNERSGGTGAHYAISFTTGATTGWTSDNNLYIAGNTANVGEYGTGVPKTFTTWKTAAGGDANGYSYTTTAIPSSSAFTAIASGDLSLNTGYRAIVGARGIAVAETVDYAGTARNATPGIGSVEYAGQSGYWMGFTNSTYGTTTNWSDGVVATGSINVVVPTYAINMPVLAANGATNNLALQSGTTLTIASNTFTINGVVSGSGNLVGSASSNLTLGGSGTVNFDQTSAATRTINNFTLNSASSVTLGTPTIVATSLTLTAGTLTNGSNLTLSNGALITRAAGSLGSAPTFTTAVNVTYTGGTAVNIGNEIPASSTVLNNLINNNTAGVTFTSGITVNGNWTTGIGGINNLGAFTYNLKGNWANSGTLNASTSSFIFSGSTANQTMSGSTFYNLEIANTFGGTGVTMLTDETVSNTLTLTSGLFNVVANTLTLNGPAIAGTTTNLVTTAASSLSFGGSSSGVIIPSSVTALNNLTIANATGVSSSGSLAIGGTMAVSGLFIPQAADLITGAGTLNGTGTVQVKLATGTGDFVTQYTLNKTLTSLTVEFAGAAAQGTLGNTYGGLKINNASGVTMNTTSNVTVGGTLTLTNGYLAIASNTLTINGAVSTGSGSLRGSATSNVVIGGAAGSLTFDQTSAVTRSLKNFSLSASATATLGNALDITAGTTPGSVIVGGSATLTTGGNLTIKSDGNGTARIGNSAGTISGLVTVERYIPQNPTRAWRLLAVPTTGQTFFQGWQESQTAGTTTLANLGTQITSNSGTWSADGFDFQSNSAGLLNYVPANGGNGSYSAVASTTTAMATTSGYFLYVRGDRTATPSNSTITATTLRTKGSIYQGAFSAITVPSTQFALIGNPYASQVGFRLLNRGADIDNTFYVWDPLLTGTNGLGAFQSFTFNSGNNNYDVVPGGGSYPAGPYTNPTIESGQAFFVHASGASTNTIGFVESSKTTGSAMVFGPTSIGEQLFTKLYSVSNGVNKLADGTLSLFDNSYSNAVNNEDAIKMSNFGLTLGILRDSKKLVVEKRQVIATTDTIFFNLAGVTQHAYQFEFAANALDHPGLFGKLVDNYLGSSTPIDLNGTTTVDFTVDANAGSAATNRFMIVFYPAAPLPVTFTSIKAYQQGVNIAVEWKVSNQLNIQKYEVEHSTDGTNFAKVATQSATGTSGSDVTYNWLDLNPVVGDNFYRVRSIGVGGESKYTTIVKVKIGKGIPVITVYPNPVVNKTISVQFANMDKGVYELKLVNLLGQVVFAQNLTHTGGSGTQTVNLVNVASGNYRMEITNPDNTRTVKALNVVN